jgi:SAM-dependent methyltransferase
VRLAPEQDVFGRVLLEHLEGRRATTIVERDDGYIEAEPPAAYFHGFRRWRPVERQALRHVRGRVLDVGLGAGRVALELQRRGHDVVGIDFSPLAVRVARKRGVRKAKVMSLEELDGSLGGFDTAVFFMNNLGLLSNSSRAKRTLRLLQAVTNEGGRIVGTCSDPHDTKRPEHRTYHRRNLARGRMPGQTRLRLRYRSLTSPWFDWLFLSQRELEEILAGTGWSVTRFVGPDEDGFYAAVIDKEPPAS